MIPHLVPEACVYDFALFGKAGTGDQLVRRSRPDTELSGERNKALQRIINELPSKLASLAHHLETTKTLPKPKAPNPNLENLKANEVTIMLEKLNFYMEHMNNNWVEMSVNGEDVFDERRKQWERPVEGCVKPLPEVSKPTRRRQRENEKELEKGSLSADMKPDTSSSDGLAINPSQTTETLPKPNVLSAKGILKEARALLDAIHEDFTADGKVITVPICSGSSSRIG